ncbi:MAG: SCO family protein [Arenicella sp.]
MQSSRFPLILGAILAMVLGLIAANIGLFDGGKGSSDASNGQENTVVRMKVSTVLNPAKPVPDFSLMNHSGEVFTKASLANKHSILFFGFINCPDICPGTLQFLKSVKHKLAEQDKWGQFQVIFISVDPARDTVEKMAQYMPYFDAEFVGVTGTVESIDAFAKSLSMPYSLGEVDEHGNYNVDHSASMLLTNEQGNVKAIITQPFTLEEITEDLLAIIE